MSRVAPLGGVNPPESFELADGTLVDLGPLAHLISQLYYDVYPDDLERYGTAGQAWCEHDGRYLLAWGLEDARAGTVDCVEQVAWLGRVLKARAFPIERVARHVELTAAVLRSSDVGEVGQRAADRLTEAASALID
jgi:hypothetical protein